MSVPRAYRTRAIVLRTRNLGEADKIVTLFTSERGKMSAVAKGIRRSKSHLAGRLEFATEALLEMHRGRSLDVIVSAEVARADWQGIVNPAGFAAASVVVEIVDALCEPDLALPDVYALLDALGLAPPCDACVRCGRALDDTTWVDEESGGLACSVCRETWREALHLDAEDLTNFTAIAAPRRAPSPTAITHDRALPLGCLAAESDRRRTGQLAYCWAGCPTAGWWSSSSWNLDGMRSSQRPCRSRL